MAGPRARQALTDPRHPGLGSGYESFYLRAVDPERPRGVWLRHTAHVGADGERSASVWVTLFGSGAAPVAHKQRRPLDGLAFARDGVAGTAGPARYDLRWTGDEPPLRHLPADWMYRAPLPRTKPETPVPAARFTGTVAVGDTTLALDGWPGMVGHNWGAEHAERWIWLHGTAFDAEPDTWLDLAIGRVRLGPVLTPWIANGAISRGGRRTRLGGPAALRRTRVREDPLHVTVELPGAAVTARSPREQTAVWRYADADGSQHHVANCSVAALEVRLDGDGAGGAPLVLRSPHGGVYELGMRETAHGLPVQPFPDP